MTTINIYYGGRGLIDDPSIYVMDKLTTVFDELNVNVKRYNLYEDKHGISVLPKTLKEADAVIITASVEWFGIGGLLQQFLDACWLYGDKDAIRRLYMMPVVLSTTYGEKEAYQTLTKAWEILGGTPCDGICAYVSSSVDFETNNDYGMLIEKKAENFYRTFTKKMVTFPSSSNAVVETSQAVKPMTLTPQESEELSMYVSDDNYVKRQKEDIEELASMFKDKLSVQQNDTQTEYITELESHFVPQGDFTANYLFMIEEKKKPLVVEVAGEELNCYYGQQENVDVYAKLTGEVMNNILAGRMTFQRAFMTGEMTAKGNFKTLRTLDQIFIFE